MTTNKQITQVKAQPRVKMTRLTDAQGKVLAKKYASGISMQELLDEYKIKQSAFYRHIRMAEKDLTKDTTVDYKYLYEQAKMALAGLYLENERLKEH